MMTKLPYANSFRDLIVYQKSRILAVEIYLFTKNFPRDESYSLVSQIRRSSRSIGAQIAEAWAKRRYEKHFLSKLTDADGEQLETQHWIAIARDCGYILADEALKFQERCEEIGRMLGSMMAKPSIFCGDEYNTVRESATPYFIHLDDSRKTEADY